MSTNRYICGLADIAATTSETLRITSGARDVVASLLRTADIRIGGERPWDIRVNDPSLYRRVLAGGTLAAGETYMDGWWDCDALDEFFMRLFRADSDAAIVRHHPGLVWSCLVACVRNPQSLRRARVVGRRHYDIGNDLYRAMLDSRMIYSCAFWRDATNLNDAQEAKLDRICQKLRLEPGMSLLDIGCGWGGLARFAAERYGVRVEGVTISEEQVPIAKERCAGLPIEIRLEDYRRTTGRFDRIVSVGMFEHVGRRNYATFFSRARKLLAPDGLLLLHTIGRNTTCRAGACDPWIDTYIFPNSELPSLPQITAAAESRFVLEGFENIGPNYDPTLMAWYRNFQEAWPKLESSYGQRFYRMWRYYLLSCAGLFRARRAQVWQLVYSPNGVIGGYRQPS